MMKRSLAAALLVVAACGSKGTPTEHYAVGTYLFTGDMVVGSVKCKFDAAAGVLDGTMILKPGEITETCESGYTSKIIAEYADHLTITFPKTAKVGDKVSFKFELRNDHDTELTPTLAGMDIAKLSDGCTALTSLGRGGAQDTGHDSFMSATASVPGTCTVSVEIELPAKSGGKTKLHGEQAVTVK